MKRDGGGPVWETKRGRVRLEKGPGPVSQGCRHKALYQNGGLKQQTHSLTVWKPEV